jgi:uncharacterized membrane protein
MVLLTAAVGVFVAPSLPEQVTTNWGSGGTPDGTLPKSYLLVGGPGLVLAIVALFELIPRIDPLRENIAAFEAAYDAVAVLVAGYLAYTYGVVLAWNLGYEFEIGQALAPAIAVLFVGIGFLLERAERNWFVGVRTPWTLSSEAVWRHTHDLAATLFKLAGVVALGGLVFPEYFVYLVAGPAAGIALFATAYSYVDYRRLDDGGDGTGLEEG